MKEVFTPQSQDVLWVCKTLTLQEKNLTFDLCVNSLASRMVLLGLTQKVPSKQV